MTSGTIAIMWVKYHCTNADYHNRGPQIVSTTRNALTMVLAPSSQRNPASELVRIFPPARSAASNTVTFTPLFLSLYAAASPLHETTQSTPPATISSNTSHAQAKTEQNRQAASAHSPDPGADDGDRPGGRGAGVVGARHREDGAKAGARVGGAIRM